MFYLYFNIDVKCYFTLDRQAMILNSLYSPFSYLVITFKCSLECLKYVKTLNKDITRHLPFTHLMLNILQKRRTSTTEGQTGKLDNKAF